MSSSRVSRRSRSRSPRRTDQRVRRESPKDRNDPKPRIEIGRPPEKSTEPKKVMNQLSVEAVERRDYKPLRRFNQNFNSAARGNFQNRFGGQRNVGANRNEQDFHRNQRNHRSADEQRPETRIKKYDDKPTLELTTPLNARRSGHYFEHDNRESTKHDDYYRRASNRDYPRREYNGEPRRRNGGDHWDRNGNKKEEETFGWRKNPDDNFGTRRDNEVGNQRRRDFDDRRPIGSNGLWRHDKYEETNDNAK
ncbi:hypothetical protein M3Y94_00883300 [Aphelenchoides besseyi]|nr:hypothetical protein M3Y94_00883300 [Aphelenchoides besseyi]KAI6223522.1 hypothetical protein M3Y95_00898900 [Aphelenchoides besseyi]